MKVCKKCKAPNEDDVQFCANCGASLVGRNGQQDAPNYRRIGVIAFVILALLLVLFMAST